jgi:hypothetical protein
MVNPPAEFVCPLSKKIMSVPMVNRYGVHFERKAILKWLESNSFCPVTANPLRPSNLISDKTLQWKIQYWAKKNGCEDQVKVDEEEDFVTAIAAIPHDHFICPLTQEVMKDPVMTRSAYNFEKSAILRKLEKHGEICPVSGKPLRPSDLLSNHKLKWEIEQWQLRYGALHDEETRLEYESKLSKVTMISQGFHTSDILRALTLDETANGNEEEKKEKPTTTADVLSFLDDVVGTVEN